MKKFLKKRWLGLPVGIITVVLLVCLLAGSALATGGYGFFTANLNVDVREAIAVGTFDSWDNLHPYGSDEAAVWYDGEGLDTTGEHDGIGVLGAPLPGSASDVLISIDDPDDPAAHTITIATIGSGTTVGSGFTPGEWIVIPLNIRNGSSGALDLGITATAGGLVLDYVWAVSTGVDFMPTEGWAPLEAFFATIEGYGGKSGSAVEGAQVLFVKISVPQDAIPGDFNTVTFELARGVVN